MIVIVVGILVFMIRDRGSCSWRRNDFRVSARLLSFNTFQKPALSLIEGLNRCAHQLLRPVQIVPPLRSVQGLTAVQAFKSLP